MEEFRNAWRRRLGWLWLLLPVLLIFCLVYIFWLQPEGEIYTYTFSPEYCKALLGCYPDDFCEATGAESREGKTGISARVGTNGDLILKVTENHLPEWQKMLVASVSGREVLGCGAHCPTAIISKPMESNCTLIVDGKTINEDCYVYMENNYAKIPLLVVVEALGADVFWITETKVCFYYEGHVYVLDVMKNCLSDAGYHYCLMIPPPGEPTHDVFFGLVNGEFVADSTILRLFLQNIGFGVRLNYEKNIVRIVKLYL